MKALLGTFNQERALVGAFSVIVQLRRAHLIFCSTNVLATRKNVWFCSNFDETREAVNKIEIHEAANKTEATSL